MEIPTRFFTAREGETRKSGLVFFSFLAYCTVGLARARSAACTLLTYVGSYVDG